MNTPHQPPTSANSAVPTSLPESTLPPADKQYETRNLLVLVSHYVILRLAWIFKTETVLVPAFLDAIAGAGWIRGCLPILNRVGQGLAPLLTSARLRRAPRKVRWLMTTSLLLSLPFFILAALCLQLGERPMPWLPGLFLFLYAFFFATAGINQMAFNTLQGKLIAPQHRGRLMSIAGMVGSVVAILAAYFLLMSWLTLPTGPGFARIFGFNAAAFAAASLVLIFINEPKVPSAIKKQTAWLPFHDVWHTLQEDRSLRRVGVATMLFMCTLLLFPHYQWLGRTALQAQGTDLMWWVIVQNAGIGVLSWLAGIYGDRHGYRIVLRYEFFGASMIPLVAMGLASILTPETRGWYVITFFMLSLTPVTIKSLFNYILELAPEELHPHYLSTMSLCMSLPLFFSPLVGWLIDWNAPVMFAVISLLVAAGGLMTFRMEEPRQRQK